jgi:hypothetical protein
VGRWPGPRAGMARPIIRDVFLRAVPLWACAVPGQAAHIYMYTYWMCNCASDSIFPLLADAAKYMNRSDQDDVTAA